MTAQTELGAIADELLDIKNQIIEGKEETICILKNTIEILQGTLNTRDRHIKELFDILGRR